MIAGRRVLATIPARGGSKRLPGKNLRLLGGRPLLVHTISAAQACAPVDAVVVSTEDSAIAAAARAAGAHVVDRPPELASDTATLGPVCRAALLAAEAAFGGPFDFHVLLQPTSPLRGAEWIAAALERLAAGDVDSVQSVRAAQESPYWMKVIADGVLAPFLPAEAFSSAQRKQELPALYYPNGAIYATRREIVVDRAGVLGDRIAPLVMPVEASVDVDTELDFRLAEFWLERQRTGW